MDILSRRKPSFEKWWPNLLRTTYTVIDKASMRYNCFAWSINRTDFWFAPDPQMNRVGKVFWPPEVPREYTLDAFIQAYATFGFVLCDNTEVELGFEKVVLYGNNSIPEHAARQLPNGRWSSKIGEYEVIEHDLYAFDGGKYFSKIIIILKRPISNKLK